MSWIRLTLSSSRRRWTDFLAWWRCWSFCIQADLSTQQGNMGCICSPSTRWWTCPYSFRTMSWAQRWLRCVSVFQDILDEMRKELSKLKEELIDGISHFSPLTHFILMNIPFQSRSKNTSHWIMKPFIYQTSFRGSVQLMFAPCEK